MNHSQKFSDKFLFGFMAQPYSNLVTMVVSKAAKGGRVEPPLTGKSMQNEEQTVDFELRTEYIELFKLLKVLNLVPSGGTAKAVITDGMVKVDGQVETRKGCKIRSGQSVEVEGVTIRVLGPPAN